VFDASGGTYGSPRIGDELREQGWRVSDNTIAQLMAELGLVARVRRRRRGLTRQGKRPAAADLVKRKFTAPAPDVTWCGDMTEIVTGEGKLYLATVIDLYSRRILGYAMGDRHDAGLVVAALHMAAVTRGGDVAGVIFHSDRGSEYCSADFARACARWKVRQSMGRVGSCFDNAVAEATFSTIKVEYVHRRQFRTRADARLKIATWIADFSTADAGTPSATDAHRSTTSDQRLERRRFKPHNGALQGSRGLTSSDISLGSIGTMKQGLRRR
jgi:transposase InsO family protein